MMIKKKIDKKLVKKLDDQRSCKNDYMWNSSAFDCECNKANTKKV